MPIVPLPTGAVPAARPEPRFAEFVLLVALMMGVTAFAVDAVLPAFPALGLGFGIGDPNRLQLVVYVYMIGFGLAQLVYGPASDIFGRKPAYLAGLGVFVVGCALALFARTLPELLAARFVQGLGAASGRVLAVAIVRDRFSGRDMARVMSLNTSVFITVPVFAPAIGSAVLLLGDWRVLFGAMLVIGLVIGAWFWRRMPETLADANRMPLSLARIADGMRVSVTTRTTLGYSTAVGLLFGCVMAMVGSAQQIFTVTFDLGAWFPLAFALQAASMGGAALVNSNVVGRYGMRRISHASILALLGLGLVQLLAAFAFDGRPPLVVFGLLLAGSQFLLGLAFPNFNSLAIEPLGHIAGTASSMIGFYTTVVGSLCGLFIGGAFDGTTFPVSLGYFVLTALAVGIVLVTERGRLFQHHHPDPKV